MSSEKVSNEQIFQQMGLITDHLKLLEKQLNFQQEQIKELNHKVNQALEKIEILQNTRLTWSSGVLAGVTVASSILTMILLRLFSAVGTKVAGISLFV